MSSNSHSINSTTSTAATLNLQATVFTSPPTSTSIYVESSRTVLLQTTVAETYNPTNPPRLRIIVDSGSQQSYLTERVKNALRLKSVKGQHLSVATFGATKGDPRHCDIVCIGVITTSGQREELKLLTVPQHL